MAINRFKISLNAARFPLISSWGQRATFVPGLDSVSRTPRGFSGGDESVDSNTAQILYGENVMPAAEGIASVGYSQLIAPTVNTDFDQIFALRDEDEKTVLYSPAAGKNYVYDKIAEAWATHSFSSIHGAAIDPLSPNTEATARVTYAYVDGFTFICYSRLLKTGGTDASILKWNSTTQNPEPAGALVTNLPFAAGEIDGIGSSNGYLLVWSGLTIAWAPFNGTAFDFEIYANGDYTGAGFQIPEDVQGPVQAIIGLPGGFIAFTTKNAIAASYHSQNIVAPWVFREVAGAGGIESYEQATVEGSLGYIVAYTTSGVQKISLNSSEEMHPELSDFIAARYIERYEFGDHSLREAATSLDFYVKVSAIANRYIVYSYGTYPGVFSFALVYDQGLKRWGKLRMVHRDCFYYSYGVVSADLTYSMLGDIPYNSPFLTSYDATAGQSNAIVAAQHGLAFMTSTGEVKIADWSRNVRATQDEAVAIIGRVQLTRTSNCQLNRAEIEGLNSGSTYVQPSYDGKNLATAQLLTPISISYNYQVVGGMIDCKNFNLVVEGTFNLSTIILEASTSGRM